MAEHRTEADELRELNAMERRRQAETERFFESNVSGSVTLTPDETKARNRRNLWIAVAIGAFVVLVFFITLTKLQAGLLAGAS